METYHSQTTMLVIMNITALINNSAGFSGGGMAILGGNVIMAYLEVYHLMIIMLMSKVEELMYKNAS